MNKLIEMEVKELLALTGSKAPAPGGGSMSALAGAIACQLGSMVYQLTEGKKFWQEFDAKLQAELASDFKNLSELAQKLEDLVDEDTKAFNSFMSALRLPKETQKEILQRQQAMEEASVLSMEIPLEIANKSLEAISLLQSIVSYGNLNSLSDAGVATHLAAAAIEGAVLNVRINLPGIAAEKIKAKAAEEIKALILKKNNLLAEILPVIEERMASLA